MLRRLNDERRVEICFIINNEIRAKTFVGVLSSLIADKIFYLHVVTGFCVVDR